MPRQITIASVPLSVGSVGPFTSGRIPAGAITYTVELTRVSWPVSGNAITVIVERSDDDGSTWRLDSIVGLSGGDWKDKSGTAVFVTQISTSLLDDGNTHRRLRISADVAQACTIGITVDT